RSTTALRSDSVRDRTAARAQFQQQRVVCNELVLVLVGDRLYLLNEYLAPGIDPELMCPADDLGHGKFAPTFIHVEDRDTEKSLVGRGVGVGEGKPERSHWPSPALAGEFNHP